MAEEPVVVVTGASRGIGRATCRHLGRAGARVVLVARGEKALRNVAREVESAGGGTAPVAVDVSRSDAAATIVGSAVAAFGRVDAVVNNAGVLGPIRTLSAVDVGEWRRATEVNVVGSISIIQHALPHLRATRGRVINMTSGLATRPVEGLSAYCASKAALEHATRVLALEETDVVVLAFSPGVVDTDMMRALREETAGVMPDERVQGYRRMAETGAMASPDDCGRLLAWLSLHADERYHGRVVTRDDPELLRAMDASSTTGPGDPC